MRLRSVPTTALLALALFATGCASKNKGKIEGTKWASQATTLKGQALPAGVLKLDFSSDGKLVYSAGPTTFTGTYTLGTGNTVTFHLDQDLAGKGKTHAEKVSIVGDNLTMTDSDGTSMTFDKVK